MLIFSGNIYRYIARYIIIIYITDIYIYIYQKNLTSYTNDNISPVRATVLTNDNNNGPLGTYLSHTKKKQSRSPKIKQNINTRMREVWPVLPGLEQQKGSTPKYRKINTKQKENMKTTVLQVYKIAVPEFRERLVTYPRV